MLNITMYEHKARITIHAQSGSEFRDDLAQLKSIPKEDRGYHDQVWIISNPDKYRELIPGLDAAMKDRDLQMELPF